VCSDWVIGPGSDDQQDLRRLGSSMLNLAECPANTGGGFTIKGTYFKIGAPSQGGYDAMGLKHKSGVWPFNVNCHESKVFRQGSLTDHDILCEGDYDYEHNRWWDPFGVFFSGAETHRVEAYARWESSGARDNFP
jgi:hypothetical protein